jgi:ribonucleoside-diphosphate reductase beta chain
MPLLEARKQYKPFEYWNRQPQHHKLTEEVPLGEESPDWAQTRTQPKRTTLTHN